MNTTLNERSVEIVLHNTKVAVYSPPEYYVPMTNTRPLLEFLQMHKELEERKATIGGTIHLARKARGMTQSDMAKAMGTTQAYLSLIENNIKTPTPGTVERAISALEGAEGSTHGDREDHPQEEGPPQEGG
jgi:DNA-binding transcriptional regulator YiaG